MLVRLHEQHRGVELVVDVLLLAEAVPFVLAQQPPHGSPVLPLELVEGKWCASGPPSVKVLFPDGGEQVISPPNL